MAYPEQYTHPSKIIGNLLEKADIRGYVTPEDIIELFPDGSDDLEKVGSIIVALQHHGVEVVLDDEDVNSAPEGDFQILDPVMNLEHISSDDTVGLYLKEMSRVPLLSLSEEVSLAQRIQQAFKAKLELNKLNGKTPVQRRKDLEATIQDGLLAREHLIKANTRLVVSIAKKYIGRGVPFLDLIQEGNLGLMKAVSKFEYERGFRFSTYATWWIRQTITRAIADQGRTIRVPVHMTDRIRTMYKIAHKLEQDLGRPATAEEMANAMQVTTDRLQWMLQVSWTPISLESPVGDDEEFEFGMFVEDEITPSPSQTAYENLLRERVRTGPCDTLTSRSAHPSPALWFRKWASLHTRRGGAEIWLDVRAHPADRRESLAAAAPPLPFSPAQRLFIG